MTAALLEQLDDYLDAAPAGSCDVEQVGAFRLYFRRGSEMPELSYARPIRGAALTDPAAVRAAFAAHGRRCRFEYLEEVTPELTALLIAAGFPAPIPRPLLTVTPQTFRPETHPSATLRGVTFDEAPAVDAVLAAAFGGDPSEADGTLLRELLAKGSCALAAFKEGKPVAAGLHSPVGKTTEVAGVGTAPTHRRQGLAGAITSALVADAFARGCTLVFLSAADLTVARVYERIGFTRVGTALDTMDPSAGGSGEES